MNILRIALYILAGLVLALGLVIGISLMVSANNIVSNLLIPLQVIGGGAVSNMIAPSLTAFLINLGVAALVVAAAIGLLLYGVGRLAAHIARLEERLAQLEGQLPEL